MKIIKIFFCFTAILLSACTTQLSGIKKSGSNADSLSGVSDGFVYYLPTKVIEVEVDFEIQDCVTVDNSNVPELVYNIRPVFTERLVADSNQRYVVDYESLSALTKVTNSNFKIYPHGMLESINADAVDKSANIGLNIIDAGFSVARGALVGGITSPQMVSLAGMAQDEKLIKNKNKTPADRKKLILLGDDPELKRYKELEHNNYQCNQDLSKLIKSLRDDETAYKLEIANDTKRAIAEENFEKAKKALVVARADVGYFTDNPSTKIELSKAQMVLNQKQALAEDAKKQIDSLAQSKTSELLENISKTKKKLTFKSSSVFEASSLDKSLIISVGAESIQKFYDKAASDKIKAECNGNLNNKGFECVKNWPFVSINLTSLSKETSVLKDENLKVSKSEIRPGLYYRQPLDARITVCNPTCNLEDIKAGGSTVNLLYQRITQLPQLGQLAKLTLKNQPFDDNLISANFSEMGGLTTLTFNTKSAADNAAEGAAKAGESYRSFVSNLISDARTERNLIRTENIEALENKQKLNELNIDIEKLNREEIASRYSSKIELLKKYQSLESLRKGTASRAEYESNQLDSEIKKTKLLIELEKLQKELNQTRNIPVN